MARYVKFTEPDARRIAAVVRAAEGQKNYALIERLMAVLDRRLPSQTFAVRVYIDGGVAGSATTPCTWTYRVTAMSGRDLGTGLSPIKRRFAPAVYSVTPDGTVGLAFFDDRGDLQLYDANELLATVDC